MLRKKKSSSQQVDFLSLLTCVDGVVDLQSKELKDDDLAQLANYLSTASEKSPGTRVLKLHKNKLSNDCLASLVTVLGAFPNLEAVDLSHNRFFGNAVPQALLSLSSKQPKFSRLRYVQNTPGSDGVETLIRIANAPGFQMVDLGWKIYTKEPLPSSGRSTDPLPSSLSQPASPSTSSDPMSSASSSSLSSSSSNAISGPSSPQPAGVVTRHATAPRQCLIGACKSVVLSADRLVIQKFKGGNKMNANFQWEASSSSADDRASFTIQVLPSSKDESLIGWAPRGMDANAKDGYLKEGYFLSSRNHPFSFSSKDSTFLPPSKRGKATSEPLVYIRSHRDIVARTVSFEVSVDAVSWSPSIIFSNIPADVPLSPTIVLHTEGSQFKIIEDVFKLLPHKQDKHSFRSLLVHGR